MTNKIFRSTVIVAMVVLLCSLAVVMGVLYDHFTHMLVDQLKSELSLAVTGTEQYGNAFLDNVEDLKFRITWVDSDGTVLFDSQVDTDTMTNHNDREEIREALVTGAGSAVRDSATLTQQTFYEARRLYDGTILRVSTSQQSVWSLVLGMAGPVALVILLAIGLSALLARHMAAKILNPLNELDLEHPLKNLVYPELSPLLHRLHKQHNQIALQMETLRRKTQEFDQITSHMQEGLVLLSAEGTILSINPTAREIFAGESPWVGKEFLRVDPSSAMRDALNEALDKGRGFVREVHLGRLYQFDLSRIVSGDGVIGAVVLAFDITERANAEDLRREFSANVSHELKTPLQGIIGSVELLQAGLVKPGDESQFLDRIRREASRLVRLIEDIIRLSQLDENAPMPTEPVDMLALAREVQEILEPSARDKGITVTVSGAGFCLDGVRRLLQEVIYNLCDNAIGYNVPGGRVDILVENRTLQVRDTGIGIPPEHHDRIFQRFYRVDKSHSKRSGGTGLGLSIVKHGVACHGGHIALDSTPGVGTTITVTFP